MEDDFTFWYFKKVLKTLVPDSLPEWCCNITQFDVSQDSLLQTWPVELFKLFQRHKAV